PEALTFTIFNSPPTQPIVKVVPQPTRPDQDLVVDVLVYSTDPDGDAVKYDFKWYKSVDHGRTWIHKVELDGSPQVSQNFINPGELWDVFYTPYEVNSTSALQALPEEYTAASRPAGFAVAQAATRSELKAMTAWDRSYVGENAPPEFRFDAIQTQWTTEGLQLSVNWTALDGDGEAMKVDLSWTDLEYSGLVAVGSGLPGELGRYSALVHPTPGKPFYLHAAVSDTKGAVTQVITGQVNLSGLQVTNQSASEVKETAAVLNGTLSSTDGQDAEVRVYWGRTDGGQEPLVWEHVETLGARSEGAFSVQLTGLLPGTRYLYRCAAKSELGEVWADSSQAFDTGLALPTSVTAVGNTYQVLLTWNAVANAAGYAVERTPQGTVDATPAVWTVGTVTEFADDSAVPGVVYAYTVKTVDWQGNVSAPSEPVSASVTAEEIAPAAYKVVAKGYAMTRDLPTTGSLTFAAEKGARPGTIKIASLKRVPANAQDDPERGIYYLKNCTQLPTLAIQGDVKTLAFDVPVYSLEAKGEVRSVSARSVTFLKAGAFEKIMLTATKPSDEGFYARTFIETEGASQVPILIKATGAVVEELASTGKTAQPVKLLDVASKVYRNGAQTKVSLGAVGSLPRVVAEVSGTVAPQSEATPSSIRGSELKSVTVAGGPIVADEIVGGLEKMTAAGGNIRCALIQSDTNLTLLQATAKKGVGGAIGTAGKPGAMAVKAQTQGKGKNKAAITKVSGQAGVSGYFYAGYNPETGQPTHSGGIGMLQTKAPAGVEGAVFLDPDQVKKMKVSPESPLLAINPDL
ncbi:MAG TPA: fibronectin type III domain-containing protein, partial [Candidatus Sumerlaeota bacterium]|nr:fibronectin type III domain-containing protein [Candidatus Sumerlaeota bacterium]